jgi:hypothetical protein
MSSPATAETIEVGKDKRRDQALADIASLDWSLPPDYQFDRTTANER